LSDAKQKANCSLPPHYDQVQMMAGNTAGFYRAINTTALHGVFYTNNSAAKPEKGLNGTVMLILA